MARITQSGSVISVTLTGLQTQLTIDMSLQRHHYLYCANADAQTLNHFFVVSGPKVWGQMKLEEFVAARAIRRVEEAIANRSQLLDAREVYKLRQEPGAESNSVIVQYRAASTAVKAVPSAVANLNAVSNQSKIVEIARSW